MVAHSTRPDQETPRCGTPLGPGDELFTWEQVAAEHDAPAVTCPDCIEDIRGFTRPRWLDDALFG